MIADFVFVDYEACLTRQTGPDEELDLEFLEFPLHYRFVRPPFGTGLAL